jgi:hypothetical protein
MNVLKQAVLPHASYVTWHVILLDLIDKKRCRSLNISEQFRLLVKFSVLCVLMTMQLTVSLDSGSTEDDETKALKRVVRG